MRYFVQLHTYTDCKFLVAPMEELQVFHGDFNGASWLLVGDFATSEAAIAACKKQYQLLIESMKEISCMDENLKSALIAKWRKAIADIDYPWGSGVRRFTVWREGDLHGLCLILEHDCDNAMLELQACYRMGNEIDKRIGKLGFLNWILPEHLGTRFIYASEGKQS